MASEITNYICPACIGPMHFSGATGNLECDYCGSSYTVEEVEQLMASDNEAALQASEDAANKAGQWDQSTENWNAEDMKAYSCPSCGAELVCDETTAATSCPYCGNPTVVPAQFDGMLKPEYVIPFKLEKENAVEQLKAHYKGKILLPKAFKDDNHIDEIKGVYVPFWLYDGTAKGAASFDAEKDTVKRHGNEEITTTKHYRVNRAGEFKFEKIPADASSKMPDDLMDSIEPYDYKDMKDFSKAYMAGFLADKYDVSAEDNAKRIKERATNTLQDMLQESVTGYDREHKVASNTVITQGKVSYAMMPVWLLGTKWNDQNFLFAMNGQTGKMVGDLPMDKKKFWGIFAAVFVLMAALMFVICGGNLNVPITAIIMKFVLVPLLVTFIVTSVLKGQLKSVHTASQSREYITKEGMKLTRKTDVYVRTTERRRTIENK